MFVVAERADPAVDVRVPDSLELDYEIAAHAGLMPQVAVRDGRSVVIVRGSPWSASTDWFCGGPLFDEYATGVRWDDQRNGWIAKAIWGEDPLSRLGWEGEGWHKTSKLAAFARALVMAMRRANQLILEAEREPPAALVSFINPTSDQ